MEIPSQIIQRVRQLWQLDDECILIRYFMNAVYEVKRKNVPFILRVTSSKRRSVSQLIAELDFITYLHQHDLAVAYPIASVQNNFVESLTHDSDQFYISLFTKAPGRRFSFSDDWNTEFHTNWGTTLAKLHSLSKQYLPSPRVEKRHAWFEENIVQKIERYVPDTDTLFWNEYQRIITWLGKLEKSKDTFGLVHGDFSLSNLCILNNHFTLFDFDNCHYSWFLFDIAAAFLYVRLKSSVEEVAIDAEAFQKTFLHAYQSIHSLPSTWLNRLYGFIRYRELTTYIWCCKYLQGAYNHECPEHRRWCIKTLSLLKQELKRPFSFR